MQAPQETQSNSSTSATEPEATTVSWDIMVSTRPAAPDVDTPGALLFARAPWGADDPAAAALASRSR